MITVEKLQEKINTEFLAYCFTGNVDLLKNLYATYPHQHGISSFFGTIKKPYLDLHFDEYKGFKVACRNGHTEIVKFLFSLPKFISKINETEQITVGLADAANHGHINLAKKIFPYIKNKGEKYFNSIHLGFIMACIDGNLDAVKYFLTDKELNINCKELIEYQPLARSSKFLSIIESCQGGHLDIVKYLTSSPELTYHVNINHICEEINIKDIELFQYFIFDLNIKKEDPCMKFLKFKDKEALDEMFKKREMYEDLRNNLQDHSLSQKTPRKNKI